MTTKREFDAQLRYMQNPPPMSMAAALKAERPEFEISIRVAAKEEQLNNAEELFWQADNFLGDTMNGGLLQALSNDTGDAIDLVQKFVHEYCDKRIVAVFSELEEKFPGGFIPKDSTERNAMIDDLSNNWEIDPFDILTDRFYKLEDVFIAGLVKLAREQRDDFSCMLKE